MATTTKKSKAKSKTSKKPATKSTKVTKAAKTTKKSVAVKAVKSTAKKSSDKSLSQLFQLNVFSAFLSVALAGVAGWFIGSSSYQIFTSLITKDELASKATTVFVPAIHALYDLPMRWYVVGVLLVSAVIPVLAATRLRKQYETAVKNKVNMWRWLEMAIVGSLIMTGVAVVNGVQDIMTLKLVGIMILVTCALGWFAEKQNAGATKPVWSNYVLSIFTGVVPWLVIAGYIVGTLVFGMVRSPWYVYAVTGTTLLGFLGYAFSQMRQIKLLQDYVATERSYLQLSIFVKVAFAIILIVGLQK